MPIVPFTQTPCQDLIQHHGSDRICVYASLLRDTYIFFFYIRLFIFTAALSQILPYMRASQLSQPLCKMQALVELSCSVTTSDKEFNVYSPVTLTWRIGKQMCR